MRYSRRKFLLTGLATGALSVSASPPARAQLQARANLLTWNMQGAKWYTPNLKSWLAMAQMSDPNAGPPDVFCVQEAGAHPGDPASNHTTPLIVYDTNMDPASLNLNAHGLNPAAAQLVHMLPPAPNAMKRGFNSIPYAHTQPWVFGAWYTQAINQWLYFFWMQVDGTDLRSGRVNMAVASRYPPQELIYIRPNFKRPLIGMSFDFNASAFTQRRHTFFALHAVSSNGAAADAQGLISNARSIMSQYEGYRTWTIAGDFNSTRLQVAGRIKPNLGLIRNIQGHAITYCDDLNPRASRASGFAQNELLLCAIQAGSTHMHGGLIDYMATNTGDARYITTFPRTTVGLQPVPPVQWNSDHHPVFIVQDL